MRDAVSRYESVRARVTWLQGYLMDAKTAFDQQMRPVKENHAMRHYNPVRWSDMLADAWIKFLASVRYEAKELMTAEKELITAKAGLKVKEPERAVA